MVDIHGPVSTANFVVKLQLGQPGANGIFTK